ncbi:histidine phosphatase superfamily [Phaeosphaeria sp. MPI-PUGE-AT-0046c]|nr:histidine phosphatase superfamily [Phaeosphaeria sp. MPI-PUGE-AT-0046c]
MGDTHNVPVSSGPPQDYHFKYTVLKGYFQQSEDETDDTSFDFKKSNFGLIDREYDAHEPGPRRSQWARFENCMRELASKDGIIKVLWLGRHGQGWHNVAESQYGTKAWDCYYSALNGSSTMTWADATLTSVGQQQALDVNALWKEQLPRGIPVPETYYVSPMTRTIETADLTFKGLDLPQGKEYKPYIKELVREALGVHTCDRRSTRSEIETKFKHLTFEPGFSEADELWKKDYREPPSARRYRLAMFLDDVFANESRDKVFLSMTSHSGAIGSILEVLGHRAFKLETGGVIPVVVRAERVEGAREEPPWEPSDGPEMCDEPPEL